MLSPSAEDFVDHLVSVAIRAGVHVAFDPNVRLRLAEAAQWRRVYARFAGRTDTLLVSNEELDLLELPADPARLLQGRTTMVVVTHGADGATATTAGGTVRVAARAVAVADPVGPATRSPPAGCPHGCAGCRRPTRCARRPPSRRS